MGETKAPIQIDLTANEADTVISALLRTPSDNKHEWEQAKDIVRKISSAALDTKTDFMKHELFNELEVDAAK